MRELEWRMQGMGNYWIQEGMGDFTGHPGAQGKESPDEERRNEQVKNVSTWGSLWAPSRQRRQTHVAGKHGQNAEKPLPEGLKGLERHSKHVGFLSVSHSELLEGVELETRNWEQRVLPHLYRTTWALVFALIKLPSTQHYRQLCRWCMCHAHFHFQDPTEIVCHYKKVT